MSTGMLYDNHAVEVSRLYLCLSGGCTTMTERICPDCGLPRPDASFNERWAECFTCRIRTVRVSPSATPTRSTRALQAAKAEETRLNVDGEAYKRLRADGFQPKSINGSAHIEANATTRFEIESGQVFSDKAQGKEALSFFTDTFGREATTPAVTPVPDEAA